MATTNIPTRDWADLGIGWARIPVEKRMGKNDSDRRVIGEVESPRAIDITLMVEHFGEPRVLAWLNGSGVFDVRARSWYKQRWERDPSIRDMDPEAMREAVYQSVLMGTHSRTGGTRVVERRVVAVGAFSATFNAGDTIEYPRVFADALAANVDANPGAPMDFLRSFIAQSLEKLGIVPDESEADETEVE